MVTQAETGGAGTTLVKVKEWLALIGAVVVILGGLLGGMRLVVAPLYTEMQALGRGVQAMDARMDQMDARMQEEFKAVRGEIGGVRGEIGNFRGEIANVRGEIGSVRGEVNGLRQDMNNEFKAVRSYMADIRKDIAVLSERVTRVETLLERDAKQPVAPDARP